MRTERTFLMELFLDDDLPKPIKIKIKDRFQELETIAEPVRVVRETLSHIPSSDPVISTQSPSMQRLMAQNPDLIPKVIPATPAAAQALAARQALINSAGNEKPENGRRSPRKI